MSKTGPKFEPDTENRSGNDWRENERVAQRRIHDDATRTLGENLNAAMALSAIQIELRDGLQRSLTRKQS